MLRNNASSASDSRCPWVSIALADYKLPSIVEIKWMTANIFFSELTQPDGLKKLLPSSRVALQRTWAVWSLMRTPLGRRSG